MNPSAELDPARELANGDTAPMVMGLWFRTFTIILLLVLALGLAGLLAEAPSSSSKANVPAVPRLKRIGNSYPELAATAVFVERLKTGEVLLARGADERLPIASLTKLMTAVLLVEANQPLALVEISQGAKTIGDADDKRSVAGVGERLKAEDILKMILISSDNDAAYAAAEFVAATAGPTASTLLFQERIDRFTDRMNERARELGLEQTHFANPAGRDDPENYSTARDLVRLARSIEAKHPDLWTISRIQETFVFGESGRRYGLVNTNPLLTEFPALYGSKTGFDDEARGTLLLLYQFARGELVAIALLGSSDRFSDGRALVQWVASNFVLESSEPPEPNSHEP